MTLCAWVKSFEVGSLSVGVESGVVKLLRSVASLKIRINQEKFSIII